MVRWITVNRCSKSHWTVYEYVHLQHLHSTIANRGAIGYSSSVAINKPMLDLLLSEAYLNSPRSIFHLDRITILKYFAELSSPDFHNFPNV